MSAPRSILVVDDQRSIRYIIKQMLIQLEQKVYLAESGEQALEILSTTPGIDLLLCDVHMNQMTGLEVLQACPHICPNLPVVLMATYSRDDQVLEALRLGAVDYLLKPFEIRELALLLNRIERSREIARQTLPHRELIKQVQLQFVFSSKELPLAKLRDLIKKTIQLYSDVSSTDLLNIELAFEECVLNAHEHGNLELRSEWKEEFENGRAGSLFERIKEERLQTPEYGDRKLSIQLGITSGSIEISVEDEGSGFQPDKLEDDGETKPYGMGLMLINNLMDRVSFNKKGTRITFEKKIVN